MQEQYIHQYLDLPESVPRCVVEINTFDDPDEIRTNVKDYTITPTVAKELNALVERIVKSVQRNEPGEGHYVHGAFGSGKSHFMGMLGLILANNPVVWEKDHPIIRQIHEAHGKWLGDNPILVIPVYMLGKKIPFQYAIYRAANERLRQMNQPECHFSEAGKLIQRFRLDVERYGDLVWQRFQEASGYSQERFERMANGNEIDRDAIAQAILAYEGDITEADRQMLYPESISRGVKILTAHAKGLGYKAVVYLVDELILYLSGKSGKEWKDEFGDVVASVDNREAYQKIPLWLIVARQKDIADIAPAPDEHVSQHDINEEMDHHQDRFPRTTVLPDRELVPIIEDRILRPRPPIVVGDIRQAVQKNIGELSAEVRQTLIHEYSLNEFECLYPFHPALISTLIDVTARLSRERTAIRLLYELLIEVHPDLKMGQLVPYSSLFDTIFQPEGIQGSRQHPELEAVWETYYRRLLPMIKDINKDELDEGIAVQPGSNFQSMQSIVKTILLAQLTISLRDQITIERILHLNYTDLKVLTDLGSHARIHDLLNRLANRTEVVNFQPNRQAPAKASVSVTVSAGPQLSDALQRVPLNSKMRHDTFSELIRPLLGNRSLREGELVNYKMTWRGVDRGGKVLFRNIRTLSTTEMDVPEKKDQEFTLFIDYPWDDEAGKGLSEDRLAIERGKQARGEIPVGFWLPKMLSDDELKDLDEYTRIRELEANLDFYLQQDFGEQARREIGNKLPGYKHTKERNLRTRITEDYLGGEVTFLDEAIRPSIFVENMNDGLDRITREVFRRLHPQHPRFQRKITVQVLRHFLDDVLVKAEQSGGAIEKTINNEDLAKTVGDPLELVEIGAQRIGIRPQSRYLAKVNDLSAERRIEADLVRKALQEAFGFTDDVVDLFLLYLIKGKGYRVLKKDQPVESATIDFGKLHGATLERGLQLEVHQWTEVKTQIADTWGGTFQAAELTISAQDELWKHVGQMANRAQTSINESKNRLEDLLHKAGVSTKDAPRLIAVQSAIELNNLVQHRDMDSFDGLLNILNWKPGSEAIERRDAKEVIRQHISLHASLNDLSPDTVTRISTMAQSGDSEALDLQEEAQSFLRSLQRQAELSSHAYSWAQKANALIDARLQAVPKPTGGEREIGVERQPSKEGEAFYITQATLVVHGKKRRVSQIAQGALSSFIKQTGEPDITGSIEVEIQVKPEES